MLSTVIVAETQFRFDTAERDREQHLIESIREHGPAGDGEHSASHRRTQPPRPVTATCPA